MARPSSASTKPRAESRSFPLRVEQLEARDVPATVLDPNLAVRTVVSGLNQPTGIAFLGANDFFILEKASGQVKRVINGAVASTVLDLAVNNNSERGLLGIALHPQFATNGFVYLYWTESSTGADTGVAANTPLLGNRVDRFHWNGTSLTHDRNIIMLRALQPAFAAEPNPAAGRGNHDGGVIHFGRDGKLYVMIGDVGRRSQMQNLPDGPGPGGNQPDDNFGGPEIDDAHLTGVILRLNDDGSTPTDNPFFRAGQLRGGEVGENLQKVFAYGLRNGFGFDFDPLTGRLWDSQNSDDAFSEINQVNAGDNLGWVQVMGPVSRVAEFKAIETSPAIDPVTNSAYFGLQQARWLPTNIANTPAEALARMTQIFEGGTSFTATLTGAEEVPPVTTTARAMLQLALDGQGRLLFKLAAVTNITGVRDVHLHLGARAQNGPVAVPLFGSATPQNFSAGQMIAFGVITDAQVADLTGFSGTVAELAERMRQGRVYANLHTTANPSGEIRGQINVIGTPVSRYADPKLSWRYEVGPVGLGFLKGNALGAEYAGDMFVGESRTFLENGYLFRLELTADRRDLQFNDPRLADRVADNNFKFDITESESLLFGRDFGIVTQILTGPNGNLYVVSIGSPTGPSVYEIFRPAAGPSGPGRSAPDFVPPIGFPRSTPPRSLQGTVSTSPPKPAAETSRQPATITGATGPARINTIVFTDGKKPDRFADFSLDPILVG
jgi:glucose/arabinose dehydrogenase